jgi:LPS export ABC transporter protein LptC
MISRWIVASVALFVGLASGAQANAPEFDVSGMTFVSSRADQSELILRSKHATYYTETDSAALRGVNAEVTTANNRFSFQVTCEQGELNLKSNDFHASGGVEGRTDSGQSFRTEWVRYNHEDGLLYTEAPVIITEESGTYRGGGFRYLVRERRFKLLDGASVVQEP